MNQLGYLPGAGQGRDAEARVARAGGVGARGRRRQGRGQQGKTTVHGEDKDAGEHLHVIDFSSFTTARQGLRAAGRAGQEPPVRHRARPLQEAEVRRARVLLSQPQRHPIAMPYAGTEAVGAPGRTPQRQERACGADTGCNYSLDVSGGWYDAGDHGKYVVNGGIWCGRCSTSRSARRTCAATRPTFGDGKLNIPENKNGSRPARRSALGDRVHAQDAGARRASRARAWCTTRSTT